MKEENTKAEQEPWAAEDMGAEGNTDGDEGGSKALEARLSATELSYDIAPGVLRWWPLYHPLTVVEAKYEGVKAPFRQACMPRWGSKERREGSLFMDDGVGVVSLMELE